MSKKNPIMRKMILFVLCVNIYSIAYCQLIRGTVIDATTKNAVGFASVYFNATFAGTSSDKDGNFELDISKNTSMPLTVSAVGYYSVTLAHFQTAKQLVVRLTPKVYELNGASVKTKSLKAKRENNLRLFRAEFLGTGTNANNCKILNENDITFNYYSDNDTLKAFALKPLIIDNGTLGYKLTYYLDKFEYYRRVRSTFFMGNMIFNDKIGADSIQKQHYNKIRKHTYLGSRMHFFRTLWEDTVKTPKFIIEDPAHEELNYNQIVLQLDQNKYLRYPKNLHVYYGRSDSYIIFLKKPVYFDKTGYFDPSGINWLGEMGEQRIADWLPYEYKME